MTSLTRTQSNPVKKDFWVPALKYSKKKNKQENVTAWPHLPVSFLPWLEEHFFFPLMLANIVLTTSAQIIFCNKKMKAKGGC